MAEGGVFITLQEPSKPMVKEATEAGTFTYRLNGLKYPVIQILTVDELLHGEEAAPPHGRAVREEGRGQRGQTPATEARCLVRGRS